MTITNDQAKLLRAALGKRTRPELKRIFAAIRAHNDPALLAAIALPKKKVAKRRGDPLVKDLEQALKPILGPASEKADLLVEHIAKKHKRKLGIVPKGLADAARQLRAKKLSDDDIRAGAKSLVAHLAKLYGDQETVV